MNNRSHQLMLGLMALITLGGCASFNDCYYEKTQAARAVKEYVKCGNPDCSPHPHDYKLGWIDGFYEVATGGCDCPPAVAPARYYKPEQILKHCDAKRHAYYSGWQDGASRAGQFPDTHYLRIYETCECPFPRCDKPCGGGECGPCTVPFIGMSASGEMIEGGAILGPAVIPMTDPSMIELPSSTSQMVAPPSQPARTADKAPIVPQVVPREGEKKDAAKAKTAEQVPRPSADTSTRNLLPAGELNSPSLTGPVRPLATNSTTQSASAAQMISFPGVPASTTASGLIRWVDPKSSVTPSSGQPIVIVDATRQLFEMIETEPVVQLAQ